MPKKIRAAAPATPEAAAPAAPKSGPPATIRVGQIPMPVYGTFRVAYGDKVKVRSLVTGFERVDEEAGAQTIAQLLAGSIGRTVQIRTAAADKYPYS